MSRKIVIITSFAESHLLKCLIPNVIDTLNPDKIIISEGLYKNGPENKQLLDDDFRSKWCYPHTNAGFDWDETIKLCQQYPELVSYGWYHYEQPNAVEAYKYSITKCFDDGLEPSPGDIVICLEADSFLYEGDADTISYELDNLGVGEGLSIKYVDFLETQYYTELCNMSSPKFRRFAYKFDNMQNYSIAMSEGFMTQSYPKLKRMTESLFLRHFCWFRPGKYKELRFDLIYRSDSQYWSDFETGLREIRSRSTRWVNFNKTPIAGTIQIVEGMKPPDKIIIRPSRQDAGRYAQFIDIEHPSAIKNHINFIK